MYGKIFVSMYDGSLHGHWQAIVTLQQLVTLADQDGVVDMTPEAISARTSIPLEIIRAGIAELEQPDAMSRTPTEEGRRIVRLDPSRDWGWRIVNYRHYRAIRTAEERREYMRQYQRARRAALGEPVSTMSTGRKQVLAKSTNSSKEKQRQSKSKTTTSRRSASRDLPSPASTREAPAPGEPHARTAKADTPAVSPRTPGRPTWLTPFAEPWLATYGGEPPFGQLAKSLRPLVDQHGPEQVLAHWRHYLTSTEAVYASPARFAATFGSWAAPRTNGRRDPLEELPGETGDAYLARVTRSARA